MCDTLIKRLRKEHNLTQLDLAGDQITREMVSLVENGKKIVTPLVAEVIAANFKKAGVNIIAEYLINPERYENLLKAREYLKNICENKSLEEIENTLEKDTYNIFITFDFAEEKASLYDKLGDLAFNKKDFEKAYQYYTKALNNIVRIENDKYLYDVMLKLSKCLYKLKRYENCLYINNELLTNPNLENSQLEKIHYNNALSYYYLNLHVEALKELDLYHNFMSENNINSIYNYYTLKAICHKDIKEIEIADKLYKDLLIYLSNKKAINLEIICYQNIINYYIDLNDKENVSFYLSKMISLLIQIDKKSFINIADTFFKIARYYKFLGENDLTEIYLLKALSYAKENREYFEMSKYISLLLDLYTTSNNTFKVNALLDDAYNLIRIKNTSENITLINKFVLYYNKTAQYEVCNQIIEFILNQNKGDAWNEK